MAYDIKKDGEQLINGLIESYFKDGLLTIEDIKNKETLFDKLRKITKQRSLEVIRDHTDDLIFTAKSYAKSKDFDKAKLFYATYFEHELNKIILETCKKKNIERKYINDVVKSVNLAGKLTWLPALLGIPHISNKHKNIILKLADDRNAYIHYKHYPMPDKFSEWKEDDPNELQQIEKTVTYFRSYATRILFGGQKTTMNKVLLEK